MRNPRILQRFWIIIGVSAVGACVICAALILMLRANIMEDRRDQVQSIVQAGLSIVRHYGALERSGELSATEAKTIAKEAIAALRYDGSNYIWINDYDARMVMHPIKPALNGKDLADFGDADGTRLFQEFVDAVKVNGGGFVEYLWPKPGSDAAELKLSYVQGFEPWGWILGSGIYIDDVDQIVLDKVLIAAGVVAITLLIATAASLFIARGLVRPINAMAAAMNRLAVGELDVDVPGLGRTDEVGEMAGAVQVFKQNALESLRQQIEQEEAKQRAEVERKRMMVSLAEKFETEVDSIVQALGSSAGQMEGTSQSMSTTSEETSRQATAVAAASEEASSNVQTVASAAEELATSIREIARKVAETSDAAQGANSEAQNAQTTVQGLATAAEKIGEVINLINSIAEQTNLLALNATIEAARAGEAGKGFAVVANEVKNLAGQTAKATEEIGDQITGVRGEIQSTVKAIRSIVETIERVSEIASSVAVAVEQQDAATQEIARNIEQASVGTQEVSSNISGVSRAAGQTGSAAGEVLQVARMLARQSDEMKQSVAQFVNEVRAA